MFLCIAPLRTACLSLHESMPFDQSQSFPGCIFSKFSLQRLSICHCTNPFYTGIQEEGTCFHHTMPGSRLLPNPFRHKRPPLLQEDLYRLTVGKRSFPLNVLQRNGPACHGHCLSKFSQLPHVGLGTGPHSRVSLTFLHKYKA